MGISASMSSDTSLSKAEKNQIYVLKALAIFGVVTAHGTAVPNTFSEISKVLSAILQSVGSMGVGIFFCVSGYLLARGTSRYQTFAMFWKKKFIAIIIPWVISSILVYLYVAVRKGGTVVGWLLSFLGYLSSYWYLAILMVLYLVFWLVLKARSYRGICVIACLLSLVSVFLRGMHVIPQNVFGVYLNVFNWCIFFALGILLADAGKRWIAFYRMRYVLYFVVVLAVVLLGVSQSSLSYFRWFYLPMELIVVSAAVCLSEQFANNSCLQKIGKVSFSIYLYHELPWAGLTANLCNRFDLWILVVGRPFVVLGVTCLALRGGRRVAELIKKEFLYGILTGYQEGK